MRTVRGQTRTDPEAKPRPQCARGPQPGNSHQTRQKVASARSSAAPGAPRAFTPRSSPAPPTRLWPASGPRRLQAHTRFHASGTPRPGAGHHGRRWRPDKPTSLGPLPLSYEDGDFFFNKIFYDTAGLDEGVSESARLEGDTAR